MNIAMIFWRKIPHETEEVGEISQSPEKSHGNLDQTQRRLPRGPLRQRWGIPSDVKAGSGGVDSY
jgi:hypothetical protein